ncbi:MAG TPA: CoA transferase [Candidatus Binataceae bacterium]|nr:CoA transferase [Candidatus Binataceae bacterium]
MSKALDGINLVEFSSNLGAAYAAMLLAEQGARALRVEPPGGAPCRGTPHFHVLNRSKRALFLDLDSSQGRARVERLLRWADIAVLGDPLARVRARGLDYAALCRINPRLVVLHLPPLGSRGPLADFDAGDELVSALGGVYGSQWAASGNPVALHFPAASYSAGVLGAAAAAAALHACESGGQGQLVEVSLLAGALSLQTGGVMRHEKMTRMHEGPADPLGPIPCYRLFRAADGEYLFIACGNATFFNKLALALDRPEMVADPRFEGAPWGVAPPHRQTLKDLIQKHIATRPRAEWLRILRQNDIPCAPVLMRSEFIGDPQVRALAMRREIDDPTLGKTFQIGIPVTLNDTPGEIAGSAPALRDDPVVEAWLAATPARQSSLAGATARAAGAHSFARGPLDGVLVLDFCSYIAGSYGPMILSQMGAEVIKIESLEGDAFRHFGFGFLGWNQGKRALALDLASAEGREIVHGLVRRAGIVVENLRPGRMRRFGMDYEALAALNPRLIFMSVNGFGNHGPEHNQPGFDPLLQARSGVMAAEGGHGHPPLYLTCAICDYGAAMLSAFGCVLALRARERTGRGQFCETSLLQSSMAFQAGEFIFYDGRPDLENSRPESRGRSALCRAYQCRDDGWLFVDAKAPAHWDALCQICGISAAASFAAAAAEPEDGTVASALAEAFARMERAAALDALGRAGVPAISVHRYGDLFDDPQVRANDLLAELHHSQWGAVVQTGLLAKFSATPGRVERAAPLLGEHTDEILARYLGYDRERIADLRRRRIVK